MIRSFLMWGLFAASPLGAQDCPLFRVAPCVPLPPSQNDEPQCTGLCEQLSEQMDRGCSSGPDQPFADTVFLRKTGLTVGTETDLQRLALIALAETLDGVAPLAAPLMTGDDPAVRYAAALQVGLAALRAGQISDPRFAEALAVMDAVEEPGVPRSDLLFLRAHEAEARGDLAKAAGLARAAAQAEPRFFNALALELRLVLAQGAHLRGAAGPYDSAEVCQAEFDQLLTSLSRIADLEPCPRVAAHLELYLTREVSRPDRAPGLHAVQVYLAVLSRRQDLARRAFQSFAAPPAPICAGPVAQDLQALLHLLPGDRP